MPKKNKKKDSSLPVEIYFVARATGGQEDSPKVRVSKRTMRDPNHLLFGLFDTSKPYYGLLHAPLQGPNFSSTVDYAGGKPTPGDFRDAAVDFLADNNLNYRLTATPENGTSYWDGKRWIKTEGKASYAFAILTPSGTSRVEIPITVKDVLASDKVLPLGFLLVIQEKP